MFCSFRLVFAIVVLQAVVAASVLSADEDRKEVLIGSALGFRSIHDPLVVWSARPPEKRWTGDLPDDLTWDQVTGVRVIYQQLHIRDNKQIEEMIQFALKDAKVVAELPADSRTDPRHSEELLSLQALLELKGGGVALISIGNTGNPLEYHHWVIVEHPIKGVGLSIKAK